MLDVDRLSGRRPANPSPPPRVYRRGTAPLGSRLAADEALFNEMAIDHLDALYRRALRLTGRAHDAQDLVQETYLRAWRSLHTFRTRTNQKAWLYRIMHNLDIDRRRAAKRTAATVGEWDGQDNAFVLRETPETVALCPVMDSEVRRALWQIPEAFRTCLLLADLEGLSHQQIANILNIPRGTLVSRLFRARQKMRRLLAEYGREYRYVKTA